MRITICLLLLLLVGCASTPKQPTQKSNLTYGVIKSQIVKGITTQDEITALFGPPNIISKNKDNNEVWTYDRVSVEKTGSSNYWTIILLGKDSESSQTTTRTLTLRIEFDNNIVKDYSLLSTEF